MKHVTKLATGAAGMGLSLFAAMPAWAQAAATAAPAATVNKGDTAWMLTSTVWS